MIETRDLIVFIKNIIDWGDVVPEFKDKHKEYIREIVERLRKYEEWREVVSE